MSDGRFNIRNDGSAISRILIDIFGGGTGSIAVQGVDADDTPVTVRPVVVGGVYYANASANPIDNGDVGYALLTDERRLQTETRGPTADDAAVTAKPVVVGGVYYSNPSGNPIDDGDVGYALLTDERRLQSEVRGPTADDVAVVAKPVVVGGVHYATPSSNPIDDGDVGYMLLTNERRAWIEDRVYDAPTDANRNAPVWSDSDLFMPEQITGSAGGNGTTSYYIILQSYSRWSIQYIPSIAGGETITLRVFQSNHDVDDPTAATYQDVTSTFFGVLGFTTAQWIEIANATRSKYMRIDVIITGYTAGTPAWTIHFAKGGNS